MNNSDWSDVSESVGEMAESLNAIFDGTATIRKYIENLDSSKIKKTEAEAFGDALHLCDIVDNAHYSLCEHSVNLFNKLQKAKGRAAGW